MNLRGDFIRDLVAKGYEVVATGPEPDYAEKIAALGARFVPIKMQKNRIGLFHDALYFIRLFALIRRERPDVVFSYTIKPNIYGTLAAAAAGVKKRYAMVTGLGYVYTAKTLRTLLLKPITALLYKLAFGCATGVFFQNQEDRDEFIGLGYLRAEKCVLVNGSGVNLERFTRHPFPKELSFLMIARLLKCKGVMEYIEAAQTVKSLYPKVRFVLVGMTGKLQDSMNMAQLQPLLEQRVIEWYGETGDVRPFLRDCSVYVLPSWREGTPRTVLEAMATGRPVITTDVPGCRETVADGRNGFLVPARNPQALAEKMFWMLRHPEAIEKMGRESFELCKEKYDVRKVNKVMMDTMGL